MDIEFFSQCVAIVVMLVAGLDLFHHILNVIFKDGK